MRLLWSCVLATGLILLGLEVYEGRRAQRSGATTTQAGEVSMLEDGSGLPAPTPTPAPRVW
jgi:hypothetical protein